MTSFARKVYRKALEVDADIYHFHDPELLPFGRKLKRLGKKVIFDSHENYGDQIELKPYLPAAVRKSVASMYRDYEKRIVKTLDCVILPCAFEGKNPFQGYSRRVAFINNFVQLDRFPDVPASCDAKHPRQLVYVGGLTEARGITCDVLASAKAESKLVLAGNISEAYWSQLKEMPAFSTVEYRGKLNREQVVELLAESQIGLFTLLNRGQYWKLDNFGVKVFEYMAMGLPIIFAASPYNKRMVEQYHFGICVDPENIEEFAGAIRYLLDHPEEAQKMGQNGRRAVEETFNWGVEEKKLLALYEEILKD